jgi:hypothetical protein
MVWQLHWFPKVFCLSFSGLSSLSPPNMYKYLSRISTSWGAERQQLACGHDRVF